MSDMVLDEATTEFREGLDLAADNRVAEALEVFRRIVKRFPEHELADDALYDVGACYLAMGQYARAAATYRQVIEDYPTARIATEERGQRESGPTAAKAWLGLVAAHLGVGDVKAAEEACIMLAGYPDAIVRLGQGLERSFEDIGKAMLASHAATHATADTVTQSDVKPT